MTDAGTTVARADLATWQRVNPVKEHNDLVPEWWNTCENCGRLLAETDEIAIELALGALPNAVWCLPCADSEDGHGR